MASPPPSHEAVRAFIRRFHSGSDALIARPWLESITTEDIAVQYGNQPLVTGRENVIQVFEHAFAGLDAMQHHLEYFDYVEPKVYLAVKIDYVVKGDEETQKITIPAFATLWVKGESVEEWRVERAEIFIDPGQVFGRMREKGLA